MPLDINIQGHFNKKKMSCQKGGVIVHQSQIVSRENKEFNKLIAGDRVDNKLCLLQDIQLTPFTSKFGNYLQLQVMDKSGVLPAKVWDNAEALYQQFKVGDVVLISGAVNSFKGENQVIISRISPVEGDVDPMDFLSTVEDYDGILVAFQELIFSTDWMSKEGTALIKELFNPDRLEQFVKTPAATKYHHTQLGGLMQHTLSVIRNTEQLKLNYRESVDPELLFLGALVHDIGKVEEINYSTSIEYSIKGSLLGHIILGSIMVSEAISQVRARVTFSEEKESLLLHIIASHHGQLEWGAVKQPMTIEALIVHHADMLDSGVSKFIKSMEADSGLIVWSNLLKRHIYVR